jgi:hypothetical protein
MAQYVYNGEETLTYTGINLGGYALVAVPGQTYELDEAPTDNRWTLVAQAAPQSTQTAPESPVAAATTEPTQTPSN